jgi:CRISPR/Cas system-associated exonuclease Cas4 (RecB family)
VATWSYSSLSLFKQCPRKYYRLKVVKDIVEPTTEHMTYGLEVHKAAEDYGKDGTPIPAKYEYIKSYIDTLIGFPGEKLYEHKMGLTRELEPCDFMAGHVWWRGIADFLAVSDDGNAILVDYKTGKSARYADTAQLELLALAIFAHFPIVDTVRAGLLFVVSKEFIEIELNRAHQQELWEKWVKETDRLDKCFEYGTWNPNPNFTCRKFCPILDCEHNGRG